MFYILAIISWALIILYGLPLLFIGILEEKSISYEENKNAVILVNYDNKRISYTQSLNSVEIDLKDTINLPFYKELKTELGSRIKAINLPVFPTLGVSLIVLGTAFIVVLQYLQKRLL